MNMHKTSIAAAVAALLGATNHTAEAALATGSVLEFNSGALICVEGGTAPDNCTSGITDIAGSYFALDGNGDGSVSPYEKIPISMFNGIILGAAQPASGSHTGQPNGSENPGIDASWNFSANTGMHQTLSPVIVVDNDVNNDGGFTKTLDFSGWNITWNGIPSINLGGGIQGCGTASDGTCLTPSGTDVAGIYDNGSGLATITCSMSSCSASSTFILSYSAVVPRADPSGFGGVTYNLYMEGHMGAVPIPAAAWLFSSGLLGLVGVARHKRAHGLRPI